MTEEQLRKQMVQQAKSWLGRREADGSYREILDVYNSIDPLPRGYRMSGADPWCAAFVSAVGKACGLTDLVFPECACEPMIQKYRAAGRWVEDDAYIPKPGDVIFYDWQDSGQGDNTGYSDHVGLVIGVSGKMLSIVEGNCSDSVMTTARPLNGRYIRGFGVPDYAARAEGQPGAAAASAAGEGGKTEGEIASPREKETAAAPEGWCSVSLPLLKTGDTGEAVRAAQLLLQSRGCGCGPDGADGEFGPNTRLAVRRFQSRRGLRPDGVIGPETHRQFWLP